MIDRTNNRTEYWASVRRDAAAVAQLPHSVRGGSAAREDEEELSRLEDRISALKNQILSANR
jgi:hypothetical protein